MALKRCCCLKLVHDNERNEAVEIDLRRNRAVEDRLRKDFGTKEEKFRTRIRRANTEELSKRLGVQRFSCVD